MGSVELPVDADADRTRLQQLGYKQELKRGLSVVSNFAFSSFSFVPGPFHLGRRCSLVVGWVAVAWVALLTVLFSLPVAYPVAEANFNYTPVAFGGVLLLSVGAWVLHARFWFHVPVTNVGG